MVVCIGIGIGKGCELALVKGGAKKPNSFQNKFFSIKDCSMNLFIKIKSKMTVEKLNNQSFQHLSDF